MSDLLVTDTETAAALLPQPRAAEAEAEPKATDDHAAALFALAVGSFALGTTEFLPASLLPTLAGDLSVSLSAAGLLVSSYALGVTLASPFLAALFSRAAYRNSLAALMGLLAAANLLAALAPGYGFLLAVRFLTAFSHGTYFAIGSTAAAASVRPGREARAIGTMFSGLTIAMATVVPLGAWVGERLGWRLPFGAAAAIALAASGLILRFVPAARPAAGAAGAAPNGPRRRVGALAALRQPRILLALAITAVGFSGIFTAYTYIAAILKDVAGLSPTAVTVVLALIGGAVTVGNAIGGRVADRNLHAGLMALYGILACCMTVFGFAAPYAYAAAAAAVLVGVFQFSASPGLQLLVLRQAARFAPGAEAVAGGLNQSAFNLGIAVGAVVGGRVVDSPPLGLRATPWVGALLLVAAIGVAAVSRRLDSRPEAPR